VTPSRLLSFFARKHHAFPTHYDMQLADFHRSFLTNSAVLDKVVGLGERGELQIEIQGVVKGAMDEEVQGWKRAVELIESTRIRGKVVLSIS